MNPAHGTNDRTTPLSSRRQNAVYEKVRISIAMYMHMHKKSASFTIELALMRARAFNCYCTLVNKLLDTSLLDIHSKTPSKVCPPLLKDLNCVILAP